MFPLWGWAMPPRVLMLHADSELHPWTEAIEAGFKAGLESKLGPFISQHYPVGRLESSDPEAGLLLLSLLKKQPEPDLVVILGDEPLDWATGMGRSWLAQKPLVIGDSLNFSALFLSGSQKITGAKLDPDLRQVFSKALALFPNTKEVLVINDSLGKGARLKPYFTQLVANLEKIDFVFVEKGGPEVIEEEVKKLGPNSLIFVGFSTLLAQTSDPQGLLNRSNLPVIGLFAHQVGRGMLGGLVFDGEALGRILGGQAAALLKAKPFSEYQAVWTSPKKYLYSAPDLTRFGLDRSDLPEGAQLINQDAQPVEPGAPLWSIVAIGGLLMVLFYLAYYYLKKTKTERNLKQVNLWLENQVSRSTDELEQIYRRIHAELLERKGAEEALFLSEQRFKAFVDHTPVGICVTDVEGGIEYANQAFCELFGIKLESIFGKSAKEVLPAGIIGQPRSSEDHLEVPVKLPGRGNLVLLTKGARFEVPGGEPQEITFVLDITFQKRIENKLRSANEEAKQAVKAKAEFLATMSHEIRTPLNSVLGMSKLILGTELNEEQEELTQAVVQSGENLLQILNGILDYSKIEAGKMPIHLGRVDPVELIESVIEMMEVQAKAKGLELVCQIEPGKITAIYSDEIRLSQVLLNLLGNAIKFTDRGYIQVEVKASEESFLLFKVKDTGIGIDEKDQSKLFEAFTQAEQNNQGRPSGTGLGLAISARLIKLLGGRIWLESQKGQGTSLFFILPAKPFERPIKDYERPGTLGPRRVLLVGDFAPRNLVLSELLEFWGLPTQVVHSKFWNPEILKGPLDLILVDHNLTEPEPGELLALIRQTASCPVMSIAPASQARKDRLGLALPLKRANLYQGLQMALSVQQSPKKAVVQAGQYPQLAQSLPLAILVVDDNPLNRKLTQKMLARMGYLAKVAQSGLEAVALAQSGGLQLILMDIQMPTMDGLAATNLIWETVKASDRPKIVALTANASPEDLLIYRSRGFDGCLSKPLMPEELIECISLWARFFNQQDQTSEEA